MKKLELLTILLLMAITIPMLVSCSKDDEEEEDNILQFNKETIVGKWEIVNQNGTSDIFEIGKNAEFFSNGTCKGFFRMETSYEINNGKIHTYYAKTKEPMFIYTLLSATDNNSQLSVRVDGTLDDDTSLSITIKRK